MKKTKKFTIIGRNSSKLFYLLPIAALCGLASLFPGHTAALNKSDDSSSLALSQTAWAGRPLVTGFDLEPTVISKNTDAAGFSFFSQSAAEIPATSFTSTQSGSWGNAATWGGWGSRMQ